MIVLAYKENLIISPQFFQRISNTCWHLQSQELASRRSFPSLFSHISLSLFHLVHGRIQQQPSFILEYKGIAIPLPYLHSVTPHSMHHQPCLHGPHTQHPLYLKVDHLPCCTPSRSSLMREPRYRLATPSSST